MAGLGYVGDSLTYQANTGATNIPPSLSAVGWDVSSASTFRVDGLVGRSIDQPNAGTSSIDVITGWRSAGFDPDTFIVALGSNNTGSSDAQWTTAIGNVLNAVAAGSGRKTVYWVGISFRDDVADFRATRFWSVLQTIAAARSDLDMVPIDYNTLIHAEPNQVDLWSSTDSTGRHMTFSGYGVRNGVIARAVSADDGSGGSTGEPLAVSSSSGTTTTSSSTFTVPADAQVGDVCVALVAAAGAGSSNNPTAPAGWTVRDDQGSGNNLRVFIISKTLGVGDPGSTVTVGWTSGIRWICAVFTVPEADPVITVGSPWSGSGATASANAMTGVAGGRLFVIVGRRIGTAGQVGTWDTDGSLTELLDAVTAHPSGVRGAVWLGTVEATGAAQGPFALSGGAASGTHVGFTVAVAPAAMSTTPSGGSTAGADVTAVGAGTRATAGSSTASTVVEAIGAGQKISSGASSADMAATSAGAGTKAGASGGAVSIAATPSGVGVKVGAGGSAVAATVEAVGAGVRVESGTGGSVVGMVVSSDGAGAPRMSGAGTVDVTLGAVGAGQRVASGAGGSTASVTVQAVGSGVAIRQGSGLAVVTLTTVGAGHNPSGARDLDITIGPATMRTLRLGTPTNRPVRVGSPRPEETP